MKGDIQVRVAAVVGAVLGEGPVWSAGEGALWFVDIKAAEILRFDPAQGSLRRWPATEPPGWILPTSDGGRLVGLPTGLHTFDPVAGEVSLLARVPGAAPGNRLNDACTDPAGRLWFGTMDDAEMRPTGRFLRFAGGVVEDAGLPAAVITNGPAVSPDGRTLYHVDTLARTVGASTIADDGRLFATRPVLELPADYGYPDGPVVDAEGCLWIGFFGGWAARRFAPDGRLLATVRFPTANVTKLAFGGPDLRTAYATTARWLLDAPALVAQPHAGDLFAFDVETPGVPVTPVRL